MCLNSKQLIQSAAIVMWVQKKVTHLPSPTSLWTSFLLHDFSNNLQVTQVINVACVEAFAEVTSLRLWFIFKTEFLAAQADEQSLRSGLLHSEQ